jgi:peptide methionine sulfoxide reductase MsrA
MSIDLKPNSKELGRSFSVLNLGASRKPAEQTSHFIGEYTEGFLDNKLLEIFWSEHDPTTPNKSGPDIGSQYRSILFYYTPLQKKLSLASIKEQTKKYKSPITTQVLSAKEHTFFKAEDYHQNYFIKTGQRACPVNLRL